MKKLLILLFLLSAVFNLNKANAELRIDVSGGHADPLPIAIPAFVSSSADGMSFGSKIMEVVSGDLNNSGLFRTVSPSSFIEKITSIDQKPSFNDWKAINSQALVQGQVQYLGDKIKVEFRLWDVFSGTQLLGRAYTTERNNWRRISHIIADNIYERLTGENGYFDTRIVYISETGPETRRIKRLAIMDQDGANHKFLTDSNNLILTPRFSPTMQEITYLSYYNGTPRVYRFNIETGEQKLVGKFPGMTFAPRYSPDGKKLLMSFELEGNSEVYEYDLKQNAAKRLTSHPAIDTSPSYSPDMKEITFNSDRSGTPQLYVMNANGSDVKRISFGKGKYMTPVWSPRGDYIAFTKLLKGEFYIGVMMADGSGERLLTNGYLVESPTWAPNGRVLMFFRQFPGSKGKPSKVKIYSIDVTGYNEKPLPTPFDASDPAWSPLLP
jgi:TolB protein